MPHHNTHQNDVLQSSADFYSRSEARQRRFDQKLPFMNAWSILLFATFLLGDFLRGDFKVRVGKKGIFDATTGKLSLIDRISSNWLRLIAGSMVVYSNRSRQLRCNRQTICSQCLSGAQAPSSKYRFGSLPCRRKQTNPSPCYKEQSSTNPKLFSTSIVSSLSA